MDAVSAITRLNSSLKQQETTANEAAAQILQQHRTRRRWLGRAAWQRGRKGHEIPGQAVDESANCGVQGIEQQVRHDLLYFVINNDTTVD